MAYTNFKATVWSKHIELELAKMMVFRDIVNTRHSGEVGLGKSVKIVGLSNPKIKDYVPGTQIDAPEIPSDKSTTLNIDQYKYFNVVVDDVDQAQAETDIMKGLLEGGANGLAKAADSYIASLVKGAKPSNVIATTEVATPVKAKELIDKAFEKLWDEGVDTTGGNVFICVPSWLYMMFKSSLTETLTDNVEMMQKGVIGMYNGAYVKLSNNLFNDGTDDHIAVMTRDSIAFADGIEKTEAYRPDGNFADAVKSLYTYGAVVARPEQIVCIKAHKAK